MNFRLKNFKFSDKLLFSVKILYPNTLCNPMLSDVYIYWNKFILFNYFKKRIGKDGSYKQLQ